ncbi:unnamed protein product [Rotaria magnacalcarata]|nr:unnamed protein product [Rotaria magnacalcarata]CAF5171785.1 unnamed protein product [Rotaria magnacalcarata]
MHQSEIAKASSSKLFQRRLSSTPESKRNEFQLTSVCTKTQLSCSTNESDDDGYGSLSSSNPTLSLSTSSLTSELFESVTDQQRDEHCSGSSHKSSTSMINNFISNFYSYIPFVSSSTKPNSSVSQSFLVLFTLPFRFIKNTLLSSALPLPLQDRFFPLHKSTLVDPPSPTSAYRPSNYMFDIYIASGEHDEYWLNAFALPSFEQGNLTFIKRQFCHDTDQNDALYDIHLRKQSRVLYYLINGSERLSHLAAELAFVIGERKHQIIVYLQTTIDDDIEDVLSKCERRDIQRSRTYLEDLARKENITLCHTRQQSWQTVLEFFHQHD